MPSSKPALSPSIVHHRLMKATKPALAYDGGDVAAWQRKLRRKLRELTGLARMPKAKGAPKVRSLWKQDHQQGTIEKLLLNMEPGCDATAYLCLPKNAAAPYIPFICVQGHAPGAGWSIGRDPADDTKPIEIEGDRDYGITCMKLGIAALCIEQRGFGQRHETLISQAQSQGWCHDMTMHALMLGRAVIGERVYDIDRAIDYLAARRDMDMARLGVMGNSGGGTASMFAAAMLPRLRYAMPSCYFCTFADSIMAMYHCECNYVPGLLLYAEHAEIMGLFAPRPVVIVAGKDDPIFPCGATRREFRRLKSIYAAAGAEGNCTLVVGDGEHRFYADDAWPKMLRYLKK